MDLLFIRSKLKFRLAKCLHVRQYSIKFIEIYLSLVYLQQLFENYSSTDFQAVVLPLSAGIFSAYV